MKQQVGRPRGVLFSGNANNGANAGFVYANSNNTPSNTNANIGSHLCLKLYEDRLKRSDIITESDNPATWQKISITERSW